MTRAILFAFFILAANLSAMVINGFDGVWLSEKGGVLFGQNIQPYLTYEDLRDASGQTVNFSDSDSMQNATSRALDYNTQSDLSIYANFLVPTLKGAVLVVHLLWSGFFGFPSFIWSLVGRDPRYYFVIVYPLGIVVGITYLIGIYSLIKGRDP